jgi:hypothetical protein
MAVKSRGREKAGGIGSLMGGSGARVDVGLNYKTVPSLYLARMGAGIGSDAELA